MLALTYIKAPRNGYFLTYITNEIVRFANAIKNTMVMGTLSKAEFAHAIKNNKQAYGQTNYYAYRFKIAPLSSRASGAIKNNYLYQGAYAEFDDEIGWNNFMLRNYDPELVGFCSRIRMINLQIVMREWGRSYDAIRGREQQMIDHN